MSIVQIVFKIIMYIKYVYTGFWWGSLRGGDHWGDPDVGGRIILTH
jgi:hypothetical protein